MKSFQEFRRKEEKKNKARGKTEIVLNMQTLRILEKINHKEDMKKNYLKKLLILNKYIYMF